MEKSNDNVDAVTKGDADLEHKLKVIKLEIEVLRQQGKLVPPEDYIKNEMWENLINLPSRSARIKYLVFLFKLSKTQEHRQVCTTKKCNCTTNCKMLLFLEKKT